MKDNQKERFPIVDEECRVIGEATRGECHGGSRLLHPVVHLHVFNPRGDIYLQKRPLWKDLLPGKWDTAVGGHIDYGETPEEALRREAREELGITDFKAIFTEKYVFESDVERELVFVYHCTYDAPIHPSAIELDGGRFWSFDEVVRAMGNGILTPNFESEFVRYFIDVDTSLKRYVEHEVIPRYDHFDMAHRRKHVMMVIGQSLDLAKKVGADMGMAFTVAAYHDVGLCEGREHHHTVSGRIIREDMALRKWFTEEQIEVMAEAAEDHRASSAHPPRSIYGRIVAEADRFIDPETIVQRTVQYGLEHYPQMSREEHYERMIAHLNEKYGRGGYLQLWFDNSSNGARLEELRSKMDDEGIMRQLFDRFYTNEDAL